MNSDDISIHMIKCWSACSCWCTKCHEFQAEHSSFSADRVSVSLETSGNMGQSSCQDSELAEARRVLEEEKVRSQSWKLWKLWMQIRR